MSEERCVMCGEIIPEGRQYCLTCYRKVMEEVIGMTEEVKERTMKIKLDAGAYPPIREHSTDAGLDIRSRDIQIVPAKGHAVFHTGVHVQLPKGTAGLLVSKSGLNIREGIVSTGLIDEGYSGEIIVKLYNHSGYDYRVNMGDKISQLVIVPVLYEYVQLVDDLEMDTERGEKGIGSTGK